MTVARARGSVAWPGRIWASLPATAPAVRHLCHTRASELTLLAHDDLRATFDKFAQLDIAVLGIGSLSEPATSRLRYDGVIDDALHAQLPRRGAVADVLSYVLTYDGEVLSSGLEDRTISIGLDDLLRTRIGSRWPALPADVDGVRGEHAQPGGRHRDRCRHDGRAAGPVR